MPCCATKVWHPLKFQSKTIVKPLMFIARIGPLLASCLLLTAPAQLSAEAIYRLVGPDGRVIYTDRPPAAGARVSATPSAGPGADPSAASGLPYTLRQVATRYPVTLYSGANCSPCSSARSLLQERGIPFAERTVNTVQDGEALKRLSGELLLPVLSIGSQVLKGLAVTEWHQYLSAAGYPQKSELPASYRSPPPTPLVEAQKAEPAGAVPAAPPPALPASREAPANPAGIVF